MSVPMPASAALLCPTAVAGTGGEVPVTLTPSLPPSVDELGVLPQGALSHPLVCRFSLFCMGPVFPESEGPDTSLVSAGPPALTDCREEEIFLKRWVTVEDVL